MKKIRESGQSLIVIALMFLGLVAIGALVVDGGSLYLNRRTAQTAADAAAMAGARELCMGKLDSFIISMIDTYVKNNGATEYTYTIDPSLNATTKAHGSVSVHTTVKTNSFLAGALGFKNDTVTADATAGCFIPNTLKNILPIAWTCRPTVGGSVNGCSLRTIPEEIFKTLLPPVFNFGPGMNASMLLDQGEVANDPGTYHNGSGDKLTYIVMDSDKFNPTVDCQELNAAGSINCDFNNDGIFEVEGGANRGWLYLGDKGGAAALKDIMQYGYPDPLKIPQWFPGTNGVAASVFDSAGNIKFQTVRLPVFNAMCTTNNVSDVPMQCPSEYVAGDLLNTANPGNVFYRVSGFAPFVITCVSKGNSEKCPGKHLAGIDSINPEPKSIEGYFVDGLTVAGSQIDLNGFDLGVYIVSLMK